MLKNLRQWPARRWLIAVGTSVVTILVIGVPTDLIDTPLFGREVPVTWWAWPALVVTGALAGLVTATYVRSPVVVEGRDRQGRAGLLGGIFGFFAVGCPVCNKLVLLALGTSGAMTYFEPVQPVIALVSIALLGWALVVRVRKENACTVPRNRPTPATAG